MSASILKGVQSGSRFTANLIRQKHTLTAGEGRLGVEALGSQQQQQQQQQPCQQMHQVVSVAQTGLPPPPPSSLFVPPNVKEMEAAEKAQFSPRRARDTTSARIATLGSIISSSVMRSEGIRDSSYNFGSTPTDSHVGVYDMNVTVALDSLVQTNVPMPYELSGQAPSQFSSPDCHGSQDDKYIAGDLQDYHQTTHSSLKKKKKTSGTAFIPFGSSGFNRDLFGVKALPYNAGHLVRQYNTLCHGGRLGLAGTHPLLNCPNLVFRWSSNDMSGSGIVCVSDSLRNQRYIYTCMSARTPEKTNGESESTTVEGQLTARQKLQRAVKEYGSTVIVFHVAISLTSLGICYLLVSSGVDMTGLIKALGINLGNVEGGAEAGKECVAASHPVSPQVGEVDETRDVDVNTRRAAGAATFVVAYAVHKVFAPVRIGITLTATPFIVRHLRRIGFLKPPKPKPL